MTSRRSQRQTHVRPRPPSTGRPMPVKIKPRAPGPNRLSDRETRRSSRGGMPFIFRLVLVAAVLVLCGGVLYVGLNGAGVLVSGVGRTVTGFIAGVTATATPQVSLVPIAGAPSLQQPTEPYTAERTVDLIVTVPPALAGDTNHRIRVYLALPDQAPAPIQEAALSAEARTVIPVELDDGVNDFHVTLVGSGGESDPSAVARYIFDAAAPRITITSPLDGSVVNGKAVDITGKTQARTTLLARNEANGSSVAGTAESDGTFRLSLALADGLNTIRINGTDPAGNLTEAAITLQRGTGKLTAALAASVYSIKQSKLPEPVTLFVTLTDPDGLPLPGADATFTLSMPGIPTVTLDEKTDASGKASFKTSIPKGADVGQGAATVLITSAEYGSTEDFTVIAITE